MIEMVSFILAKSMELDEDDWSLLRSELTEQLEGRGFNGHEIDIAFEVANRIRARVEEGPFVSFPLKTNQVYQFLEALKLTKSSRGYLMKMVQQGILTPQQREDVVERALLLDTNEVDVEEVQFLVNQVLGGDSWPGEDSPSMSYVLH
ncbi:MAG: DUF494 family protein [Candidatus Omnitrophica bacterium]|nr:DUF494 family protein [Candidatus Omnitrophota bacterium]